VRCFDANVAQLGYVLVAEEPEISPAQVMADLPSAAEFLALNTYTPTAAGKHTQNHHANSCECAPTSLSTSSAASCFHSSRHTAH
jgi:hypothetical protein